MKKRDGAIWNTHQIIAAAKTYPRLFAAGDISQLLALTATRKRLYEAIEALAKCAPSIFERGHVPALVAGINDKLGCLFVVREVLQILASSRPEIFEGQLRTLSFLLDRRDVEDITGIAVILSALAESAPQLFTGPVVIDLRAHPDLYWTGQALGELKRRRPDLRTYTSPSVPRRGLLERIGLG